jgi:hypothetical protein
VGPQGGVAWADATGTVIAGLYVVHESFENTTLLAFQLIDANGNLWGVKGDGVQSLSFTRAVEAPFTGFTTTDCTGSPISPPCYARVVFFDETVPGNPVTRVVKDNAQMHTALYKSFRVPGGCVATLETAPAFFVEDTIEVSAPQITAVLPLHPVLVR